MEFVWQLGKQTDIGKQVDKAAKAAALRGGIDLDREYKPGLPYPAKGQTDVIRPYAKKIVIDDENRISFNCFDENTQMYHSKFYAFAPPLLSAELHKGNGHRVEFNSEPKYPQILRRIEGFHLPVSLKRPIRRSKP